MLILNPSRMGLPGLKGCGKTYKRKATMDGLKLDEMKKVGVIAQRQKGYFIIRLRTVAGDLTADELVAIADVSSRFADGRVHLTTRQAVEIHNVLGEMVGEATRALEESGIVLGVCGPRGRGIVACPGASTCTSGIIETKGLAKELDARYLRREAPHKFKIAIAGCPNNCSKPIENDVGVMGGVLPGWREEACTDCGLCISVCPADAVTKKGGAYLLDAEKCILCGICASNCPASAWKALKSGYVLSLGGTLGKRPRLGTRVAGLIETEEELLGHIERAFKFYQRHGRKKERFGHALDRVGLREALQEILGEGVNRVDLRGVSCPLNFARAKVALDEVVSGQRLEFFLDEGEPIVNVTRSLKDEGHKVINVTGEDVYFRVLVEKA